MRITATEAKNQFGRVCVQAQHEPVFVEKAGRLDTVILSARHYEARSAQARQGAMATRQRAFKAEFADWIARQNALVDRDGVPGEDLRPW